MAAHISFKQCFVPKTKEQEDKEETTYQRYTEIMSTLPRVRGFALKNLYQHQGFWYVDSYLPGVMAVQNHFMAHSSDILLASPPKCGTTWLKSLIFAICNRKLLHPLLNVNPHQLVPFLEFQLYANNQIPVLDILPSPRLFATHIPYSSLPQSILDSGCPIVYICRNPKDAFVSLWHFLNKISTEESTMPSLEEAFEMFCNGASHYGPFWDHVLEYWRASLDRPQCVMFFKYEEMQAEVIGHVKRLAEFIRCPFSLEEEKEGVVDEIIRLCSFENLSRLDVNKAGDALFGKTGIKSNSFFRKGKVGDWSNYLTPNMIERLDRISEQKFHGYGLTLG
ncbi:hypothetical protein HHK36_030132 [Tetracentron sinense]|uniref:Sulfotransferase n=1 Tax=Tetracentron sinense TaxID=13715 RepID=A0A834YC36_TETSI|nr:hypothetical protein HHK36_030132 [Tetracentron sinense]